MNDERRNNNRDRECGGDDGYNVRSDRDDDERTERYFRHTVEHN